jgi:hypothetical protein
MRFLSLPCAVFLPLLPTTMRAGETPPPPASLRTHIDGNDEFRITFDSSSERRYIVETSQDFGIWEEHYLSPFKDKGDGLSVRQVGEYAPRREFYRVAVLPWRFQSLHSDGGWIGEVSMSRLSGGRTAFVYQNRDLNELYYGVVPDDGGPPVVERVIGTNVADDPGPWDDSGYTDVTLQVGPSGSPRIVCMDDHAEEMILLTKPSGTGGWRREVVRAGLSTPFWTFPKFAISPQGMMGIVYRGDDGSYLALAAEGSHPAWEHRKISDQSPHNAFETGIVFNNSGDAIVQANGSFFIDAATREVSPIWLNGQLQCHRGADGSLLTMGRSFDGTTLSRSVDGGLTWTAGYAARLSVSDAAAVSIDCDPEGRLSLFRPPALYRQLTPGGGWQRTVMRGGAIHQAAPSGKIRLILSEYDREVSWVTED